MLFIQDASHNRIQIELKLSISIVCKFLPRNPIHRAGDFGHPFQISSRTSKLVQPEVWNFFTSLEYQQQRFGQNLNSYVTKSHYLIILLSTHFQRGAATVWFLTRYSFTGVRHISKPRQPFVAHNGHFGFCWRCGIAGSQWVPPALFGWYFILFHIIAKLSSST